MMSDIKEEYGPSRKRIKNEYFEETIEPFKTIKIEKYEVQDSRATSTSSFSRSTVKEERLDLKDIVFNHVYIKTENKVKAEDENVGDDEEEDHEEQSIKIKKEEIYELKIVLRHTRPPIWRRIHIHRSASLKTLHYIIQEAMGWRNSHLHQFKRADGFYRLTILSTEELEIYNRNFGNASALLDENFVTIADVFRKLKDSLTYMYDGWQHIIILEARMKPQRLSKDEFIAYPKCIAGMRACPPEDCGNVEDYEKLVKLLKTPKHKQHANLVLWLQNNGYVNFNPEEFKISPILL